MLVFRKARMEDKENILNISKTVWEGDDYLPNIYEKWVEEEKGEFTIVELDGDVVGCAKFTVLRDNEYWLEGIRVNEKYRGLGIGKKITSYYLDKAKKTGYKSLSLSTYIENYESIKIIEKFGFENTIKFMGYYHDNNGQVMSNKVYERVNNFDEVRYILSSDELAKRKGYFAFDWTFVKASKELLEELIKDGSVYTLKINGEIKSTIILSDKMSKSNELSISYIDGENYYVDGFKFAMQKYQDQGYDGLIFMCPGMQKLKKAAIEAGLMAFDDYDENVLVYEYLK